MFKDAGVVRTDAPKNDKMHFCKRYLAQFRRIEAGVKAPLLKCDTEAFRALQRHITIHLSWVAELEYSKIRL